MKTAVLGLAVPFLVLAAAAQAAPLTTIGTATYGGATHKLIFEGELNAPGLVWLDYTRDWDNWGAQMDWAANLGASLSVTLYPGYATTIDWRSGWRLPTTVDGPYAFGYDGSTTAGYNITSSEMGHLYYTSLGNKGYSAPDGTTPQPGWGFLNSGPFDELEFHVFMFSGTEYAIEPGGAWYFWFYSGNQSVGGKGNGGGSGASVMALIPGAVMAVPAPGSMLLAGTGLALLAGSRYRRSGRLT